MEDFTNSETTPAVGEAKPKNKRIKWLYVIGVLVAVAILWLVFAGRGDSPKGVFDEDLNSTEFAGRIERIEGNTIFLNGNFIVTDRPEFLNAENIIDVAVTVSETTEFIKNTVYLPSPEEVADTDGYFNASDLRQEKTAGSFDDLISDIGLGLEVTANGNIFGQTQFTASKIEYIDPVLPE